MVRDERRVRTQQGAEASLSSFRLGVVSSRIEGFLQRCSNRLHIKYSVSLGNYLAGVTYGMDNRDVSPGIINVWPALPDVMKEELIRDVRPGRPVYIISLADWLGSLRTVRILGLQGLKDSFKYQAKKDVACEIYKWMNGPSHESTALAAHATAGQAISHSLGRSAASQMTARRRRMYSM